MTSPEVVALVIQVSAVLVAIAASIVALVIGAKDRRFAQKLAAQERERILLQHQLDVALRLLENMNRGGSSDSAESKRMGAEALTLIGYLGPERVPRQWSRRVDVTDEDLKRMLADANEEEFLKDAYESQLAVNAIVRDLREL